MAAPLIAGLEIGTTRTVVCIGETDEASGRMKVTGLGTYPTIGVRKGQIVDLQNAQMCVRAAIKNAEREANATVWQVIEACKDGSIATETSRGALSIRSEDGLVTAEDVEEVREIARNIKLKPGRQLLHTIRQTFQLDGQTGIVRPEGMACKLLALDVLAVTGDTNRIENLANAAKNEDMEVTDVVFSGICAAMAVLTPEQKKGGAALIDLGGGTTSYIAYCNNAVAAAGCIAVGGDHVTNDIAQAFNISLGAAEEMKCAEGSAVLGAGAGQDRVAVKGGIGFDDRSVSRKALHTVINARMDELLRAVRSRLDDAGILPHLGGGVLLTGGGAYLRGAPELARLVFGMPARIGLPAAVDGLEKAERPAALATAAGLLLYSRMNGRDEDAFSPVKNFFKGLFKGWREK